MSRLEVRNVEKRYGDGPTAHHALRGLTFSIDAGEFVALRGPSGCGKSTLLHLVGAMDQPTAGEVTLGDKRLDQLTAGELARVRRRAVGFVFQSFNLLPTLSAAENVALPMLLDGCGDREADRRAAAALESVGLADKRRSFPSQLSGGEAQRVAIARATAIGPQLLIADEPTGSLDSENGDRVLQLLASLNADRGLTILMATHSDDAAAFATRTIEIRDGRLVTTSGAYAAPTPV